MCTVTYLPKGTNKYILTSNRDEAPKRAALPPQAYSIGSEEVFFPKDPLAGGTWIATNKKDITLCLLNGGYEKHKHKPPYKRSRGLVLLDYFDFKNPQYFSETYDFSGIEPFTLILIKSAPQNSLHQLVWSGAKVDLQKLDENAHHIWSSSTLYPEAVRNERKTWFDKWNAETAHYTQPDIIEFHRNGGKGDAWNDFVMDRNGQVKTVSITSIEKHAQGFEMIYQDLLKEKAH